LAGRYQGTLNERPGMSMRTSTLLHSAALALLTALGVLASGCTETPSYFPPCVDPYTPCLYDAGNDAGASMSDSASAVDASDAASPEGGERDGD
jgi:hypothetical protein